MCEKCVFLCLIDRAWGQSGQRGAAGERILYLGIQEGERTHGDYISDFNQDGTFGWCTPPRSISCFLLNHQIPFIQMYKTHSHSLFLSVCVLGPYWFWMEFLEWVGVAVSSVVSDWTCCGVQTGSLLSASGKFWSIEDKFEQVIRCLHASSSFLVHLCYSSDWQSLQCMACSPLDGFSACGAWLFWCYI